MVLAYFCTATVFVRKLLMTLYVYVCGLLSILQCPSLYGNLLSSMWLSYLGGPIRLLLQYFTDSFCQQARA